LTPSIDCVDIEVDELKMRKSTNPNVHGRRGKIRLVNHALCETTPTSAPSIGNTL
jgi:hypothetical protein